MSFSFFSLVAFLALASMACAQPYLGPASFAWPLSRPWNYSFDSVPPCGSSSLGPRSKFPLYNGYLVFISTYDTRDLELKISYNQNPQTPAEFDYLVPWRISDYGVGFTCIKISDSGLEPGTNATFQLRFASDYNTPTDRSFFVCADITFVDRKDLDYPFPCVNTTDVKFERLPVPRKKPDPPKDLQDEWSPGKKKKRLSEGAIAGIALAGAVAFAGIVVTLIRVRATRRKRNTRQREVPCRRVPGSYGLPDVVPVENCFMGRPTRR